MKHFLGSFIAVIVFSASFQGVFAATDIISDFCASPTAQQDYDAQKLCADLKVYQDSASKLSGEKDSIEKDIKVIDGQIQISQQKIKVQQRIIAGLNTDISAKTKTVNALQAKIDAQVSAISSLIQKVNGRDSTSLPEILLGSKQFSDFYVEVDTYATLNRSLTALIEEVRSSKAETEAEKEVLEDRKDKETNTQVAIAAEQRLIERKKAEKKALLDAKTADYNVAQKILTDQKQKVAAIRARLFKFQDGEGIPFGDAYDFAAKAAKVTAVRPAFLLAILAQESSYDSEDSSFGKNVGQCFVRNQSTGAGVGANTGTFKDRVMHPTRDIPVFLKITAEVGRDWMNTRVSCALSYGYGGAMGVAQFIPSTWALYGGYPSPSYNYNSSKDRVMKAFNLGEASNPFIPEHAIAASSLYLSDLGAGLQTYTAEKNAACRYYSGSKCPSGKKSYTKKERDIIAYGTNVANRAIKIQEEMIDPILGK